MLAAKQLLRGTELWKVFEGDQEAGYDAFSVHKMARGVEDALNACGLISSMRMTRWQYADGRMVVEGLLVIQSVDDRADTHETPCAGEDLSGDKALNKAISFARKNGMIQALNLGIGFDQEAEPKGGKQPYGPAPMGGAPQQQTATAPKAAPQPMRGAPSGAAAGAPAHLTYVLRDLKGGTKNVPHAGMQAECWAVIANSITIRSLNEWVALNASVLDVVRCNDRALGQLIDQLIAGRIEALKNRDAA